MPTPRRTSTPSRPWSTRLTASLLAFILAVIGLPAGTATASTTNPDTAAASTAGYLATDPMRAGTAGVAGTDTVNLTLVTGDTVHVTIGADGRQTATVSPAPRSDGSSPGFWTHRRGEDLYVVPQDVAGLLPRRLDPGLFNVSALIEQGLAGGGSLPLIVTYRSDARMRTHAALSSDDVRQLGSVNGIALSIDRDDTATVRQALHRLAAEPQARTLAVGPFAGLEKIWLDRPVEAALDESTTQIGATSAWQDGHDGTDVTVAVLDTGIDTEHPDVAAKVVAAANFTDSDSIDDRYGHGTHVASTIAGSGEASGGQYTGVAPGVDLMNGKVLNDFGSGATSGVIDGMEWAAQQGADIINMSLGERGSYTDGTDPASLAVNALTEQHGTLFVISAGNAGPGAGTITTPATADRALTVGSVDKSDEIADTSSRGPRAGDGAVKPDITAPGVNIAAARADGTALCEFACDQPEDGPINEHYTSASGTSMAAPHVAGAAALISGARPDLDAMPLKSLLMGTANPSDVLSVYEQGAGQVDVTAALAGQVVSSPASVSFGEFSYPHDQRDPIARTVTYTNFGDEPRTLELAVDVDNGDGEPAPEGALTLSTQTLTVAAGESDTVTLTLDTGIPGSGQYGGALVAQTADGDTVRTPVGYYTEQERYNVHVEGIARDGRPAYGRFQVVDVVDGSVSATRNWGAGNDGSCTTDSWASSNCIRVEPGTYSVSGMVFTMPQWAPSDERPAGRFGAYLNTTLVAEPEITIDGATTLTLDAREAVEVEIATPDHRTKRNNHAARQITFYRAPENGEPMRDGFMFTPRSQLQQRLFMQPTDPVTHGELAAYTQWQLAAPAITLDVVGSDAVPLNPLYYPRSWFSDESRQFPQLEGSHRLPVVDAGTATPEEIEGLDLDGALALVRRSDGISVADQSHHAAQAGAAMVAVSNDVPGSNADPGETGVELQVPTVRLSHAEGTSLRELLQQRPVTVRAEGRPVSPYRYHLTLTEEGSIPSDLRYVTEADELAAVENSFHSQLSDDASFAETWYSFQPWEDFALGYPTPNQGAPRARTDYYVPGGGVEYLRNLTTPEAARWPEPDIHFRGERRSFEPGERVAQSWFNAPLRPGLWPDDPVRRAGDQIRFSLAAFTDGDGHVASGNTSATEDGFTTRFRMEADGELVAEGSPGNGILPVPPDAGEIRIEYDVDNAAPWANLSTSTRSVWTFESSRPADGQTRIEPLLTVDYDLDVDLHNRMPPPAESRGPQTVEFTVGHQSGAPDIPVRGDASLEISYDSGESWREIRNVREVEDGHFRAYLPRRAPKQTDGFVSLRVRAEDHAGNTVEQEIIRAYALSPR